MPARALRQLTVGGHHQFHAQDAMMEEEVKQELPDAVEVRLLLAEDFGEHLEWAMNGFFEREIGGDRGREWGFAQSVVTPLTSRETFKAGVEMQYLNFSDSVRYSFDFCSCGNSMLHPTDVPPASNAPRLAASIIPGPPPVMTA